MSITSEVETMRKAFEDQLLRSAYIHAPLETDDIRSMETRLLGKKVLEEKVLWNGKVPQKWTWDGLGEIRMDGENLQITNPARADFWPSHEAQDGDYASFGRTRAHLSVGGEDWTRFHRITFEVKPNCPGSHSPLIQVGLVNSGEKPVPDIYDREGYHLIHLRGGQWNHCVWEFTELSRDRVEEIFFCAFSYGQELSAGPNMDFLIRNVRVARVEDPEVAEGWRGRPGSVSFSTTGYWLCGKKTAIAHIAAEEFSIVNECGDAVYSGRVQIVDNEKGRFSVLDFSSFKEEGTFAIKVGGTTTETFQIGPHVMEEAVWRAVHFLYAERCGGPIFGRHGTCHGDIVVEHHGLTLAYAGGWHDAGDVSQQTAQTAEVAFSLMEMAQRVKDDHLLYMRLLEEAQWGLDFVLRMRFGDGYRATSAGIRRWTNGLIGDMDDCPGRVHNHAFENFLMGGVEAYAAVVFREADPELSWKCATAAQEDYQFALKRFEEKGMELPNFYEHTYNSSLAQYWATASWAASFIYAVTGDKMYGDHAVHFGDLLLTCQETGSESVPMRGFFYREPDHKTIVHFTHQGRDQIFIQALEQLCVTQWEHQKYPVWKGAMKLHGEYLKALMCYTAPYGMIAAGLHSIDEVEDAETFALLHLLASHPLERDNYIEQLKHGNDLGEGYYVRCFPVWFSFRGNTAVHLSLGKAAAILGRIFEDEELLQIAREQLYWTAGKNPFGQSLVYGEGSNYAQQYGALSGEMVGAMPVGIQTKGNADCPYWPMANNATYREVWTTSAGKWLSALAEIY